MIPRADFSINKPLLVGAVALTVLTGIVCISLGAEKSIRPWDLHLWQALFNGQQDAGTTILFSIRLPRLILAFLVGGCLSLAGLIFQNLLRNPLADPFIIGVSGGAALVAVTLQMLGLHHPMILILGSFVGGVTAMLLVERIAAWSGSVNRYILILSGVILNAFFSALISCFLFFSGENMPRIFYWLMGSLNLPETTLLIPMFVLAMVASGILFFFSHSLNILSLGDNSAYHLGVDPERIKWIALICASILTAIAVSMAGMIGFIGMFVPHMIRMAFGGNHKILIPLSLLCGGIVLMITDTVLRITPIGREIPVGTLTALMGAPFFLWLLTRKSKLI